jgi:hypothetical protein
MPGGRFCPIATVGCRSGCASSRALQSPHTRPFGRPYSQFTLHTAHCTLSAGVQLRRAPETSPRGVRRMLAEPADHPIRFGRPRCCEGGGRLPGTKPCWACLNCSFERHGIVRLPVPTSADDAPSSEAEYRVNGREAACCDTATIDFERASANHDLFPSRRCPVWKRHGISRAQTDSDQHAGLFGRRTGSASDR